MSTLENDKRTRNGEEKTGKKVVEHHSKTTEPRIFGEKQLLEKINFQKNPRKISWILTKISLSMPLQLLKMLK